MHQAYFVCAAITPTSNAAPLLQVRETALPCSSTHPAFSNSSHSPLASSAADIAGVNLLSLVTAHAAAALKWGTDHKVEKFNSSKLVIFYDMGATSTVSTLVEFSSVKDKSLGRSIGQLKVRTSGTRILFHSRNSVQKISTQLTQPS
jgi:molecular chaperone DnaK (HSP70)